MTALRATGLQTDFLRIWPFVKYVKCCLSIPPLPLQRLPVLGITNNLEWQ